MIEIKIRRSQIEFFRYNFITLQAEGTFEKTLYAQEYIFPDETILTRGFFDKLCAEIKNKAIYDLELRVQIKICADGKIYLEHDALAFPYEAIGEWRLFKRGEK